MPKNIGGLSADVLNAALYGLETQKQTIERHIQQVRSMLGLGTDRRGRPPKSGAPTPTESGATSIPTPKRKRFSAETRARMAEAQHKRYAAAKKVDDAPKLAAPKKRKLSAAGRKRIIEATKKRWAAYKAKQAKA